jgi:hypothetical protein
MGLDRKTTKPLDTALGGSFLHVSTNSRSILTKILENTPKEVEKKPLEEESQIAEPKSLPNLSPASAIPNPESSKKEETPISDFMLEFEDELFDEYGDTLNYHTMRRPQKPRESSSHEEILDPSKKAFLKKTAKELVSIISNEWLEELELFSDVIRLDSPSIFIRCQINKAPFDALYNPVVGVNIMSASFAHNLLEDINPNNKVITRSFRTHSPKFENYVCPPYLGKRNQGLFELLYL